MPLVPEARRDAEKLTAKHIQEFYTVQGERVKANTVIHYHAVIHRALKYAVKTDLLPTNSADKIQYQSP